MPRGGKRDGAGRPKQSTAKTAKTFRLSPEAVEILNSKRNQAQWLEQIITKHGGKNMELFEGVFWQATLTESNRFGTKVGFTSVGGDNMFQVPPNRVEEIKTRLLSGEDPDAIALSLPIEE